MAIGIPIVCNQGIGDTDSIVRKYNAGIVLENFTEEEYLDAMISFRSKVFKTAEIRKGAIDFFSLSDGVDKYDKIYKSICGEQS